jgi:hypothetical protein
MCSVQLLPQPAKLKKLLSLIERKTAMQRDVMRESRYEPTKAAPIRSLRGNWVFRCNRSAYGASALPSERWGPPPRIAREARLQLIALACEPLESEGRVTPKLGENGRAPCGTSSDGSAAPKCSACCRAATCVRPESSNGYTGRILRLDNAQSDFCFAFNLLSRIGVIGPFHDRRNRATG